MLTAARAGRDAQAGMPSQALNIGRETFPAACAQHAVQAVT